MCWEGQERGIVIVGSRFRGDGNVDSYVMWRQHDVYHEALGIIAGICQEYIRWAYRLIGNAEKSGKFIDSFDHRTLQASHDVLAAVWRYRYEYKVRQMELPGFRPCRDYRCPLSANGEDVDLDRVWTAGQCRKTDCLWLTGEGSPDVAGHWLDWLRNEVRSWQDYPHLIRLVMEILTNQNNPVGYRAEDALRYDLLVQYEDVPWTRRIA